MGRRLKDLEWGVAGGEGRGEEGGEAYFLLFDLSMLKVDRREGLGMGGVSNAIKESSAEKPGWAEMVLVCLCLDLVNGILPSRLTMESLCRTCC